MTTSVERFCTEAGRPFCVYAVLGSRQHAARLVGEVSTALAGLSVAPRSPAQPVWSRPAAADGADGGTGV